MVVLSNFPPPNEGVKITQPHTVAYVGEKNLGLGTLYIAESRVSWMGVSGNGFSLEYPHIALHAVSRDLLAFPSECLYLMIDSDLEGIVAREGEGVGIGDGDNENSDDETSSPGMTEVRFIPEDKGMLDALFQAMSTCQTLHPDPDDSVSEEEAFEDAEDDAEEGEYELASGHETTGPGMGNLNGTSHGAHEGSDGEPMDVGQFDDADMEHLD